MTTRAKSPSKDSKDSKESRDSKDSKESRDKDSKDHKLKPMSLIKKITRNQFSLVQFKKLMGKNLIVLSRIPFNKQVETNSANIMLASIKPDQVFSVVAILRTDGVLEVIKNVSTFMMIAALPYDDIKKKNLACVVQVQQYNNLTSAEKTYIINAA